jgi:LysM repeat protein
MLKWLSGKLFLVVLLALALTGCFRQSEPDVAPPASTIVPTVPQTLLPPDGGFPTPFVTPFVPGEGPDMTSLPTLGAPSPTLPLVTPQSGATQESFGGEDAGILSLTSPAPSVTNTIPFAAGPTFTPLPGAPPINLNPNLRPTPTVTPGAGQSGASAQEGDPCTYTVQAGDTAFYIATIHGLTLVQLIEANDLENADFLFEGQVLQIPGCGENLPSEGPGEAGTAVQPEPGGGAQSTPSADGTVIHVVQAGENLFRISLRYGVTVDEIVAANNLGSPDAILSVGQELIIPAP